MFYPFLHSKQTVDNHGPNRFGSDNSYDLNDRRMARIRKSCSFLDELSLQDELDGPLPGGWTLAKVIVLIRHGDRGPLRLVRHLDQLNCDRLELGDQIGWLHFDQLINRLLTYRFRFVRNLADEYYHVPGRGCELGQLTRLGIGQHIKLGSMLAERYQPYHLFENAKLHQMVRIVSTRYPRTYQSAWSFIFGFSNQLKLRLEAKSELVVEFTEGNYFCGQNKRDRWCRVDAKVVGGLMDSLRTSKILDKVTNDALKKFINQSREIIAPDDAKHVQAKYHSIVSISDGFKAYICHQAALPCRKIDGECLTVDKYRKLTTYLDQLGRIFVNNANHHKLNFLRSYALLRRFIAIAADKEEEDGNVDDYDDHHTPKLWLFSGHDITLEAISAALGFYDGSMPPYASRLVVEVFDVVESRQHDGGGGGGRARRLLRFVYNGKDVTKLLEMCRVRGLCVHYPQTSSHSHVHDQHKHEYLIDVNMLQSYLTQLYEELSSGDDNHDHDHDNIFPSEETRHDPEVDEIEFDFHDV